jgi:hypothetical protein
MNDSFRFDEKAIKKRLKCVQCHFEGKKRLILVKQCDNQRELRQEIVLK